MLRRTAILTGLAVTLVAAAAPALGASLGGQVKAIEGGRAMAPGSGLAIYFRSDEGDAMSAAPGEFIMSTRGKEFDPTVLMVPTGATVRFPNRDPILHNVFSPSGKNRFDVGLYGTGDGKSHTFEDPGLVRVFCNVHQSMVAHILVLDTPHFGLADDNGRFELHDLPEVPGKLYVWHERARRPAILSITPPATALSIELQLTARQVPNHKNKNGQSYRRDRRRY